MKLSLLLRAVGLAPTQPDVEIARVTDALPCVRDHTLFVCIRGNKKDGHTLASAAVQKGAAAVVAEAAVPVKQAYYVQNSRRAFSLLSAAFYGQPQRELRLIGITGTNGKTTTAFFLRQLLEREGKRCAMLGTEGLSLADETLPTGFTTPASDVFFASLRKAADCGCEYLVAEVSSQALAQYRVDGARFSLGILTNVGRDHLDYHGDLQSLAAAKTRLCSLSDRMLVNADDRFAGAFCAAAAASGADCLTYTCEKTGAAEGRPRFTAGQIRLAGMRSAFDFCCTGYSPESVSLPTPGIFSVYNALAAMSAAVLCGVEPKAAAAAAGRLELPPGRAQCLKLNGVRVCIDFAHTPEALAAILKALYRKERRLIAVFGCGGDRDRGKRPLMGRAAAENATALVLTSDNPRSEDPERIIDDIMEGIPAGTEAYREADRRAAIRLALQLAKPGDAVVIAGKGHETVQLIGDKTQPFSDLEEVLRNTGRGKNTTK